jgi:putative MATE family efflux protein
MEEDSFPKKKSHNERDWTQGSIIGSLWGLSWPMAISATVTTLGPTVDMIWVGKLGSAAIAGVGVSTMVVMLMHTAIMGLQMGTRAMVARFIGANDREGANHASQQAFVVAVASSIFMAILGIYLADKILMLLGLEADVVAEGSAYLKIQLIGIITISLQMMSQSIMQASGDTLNPMKITLGARIFHIIICPFFVFGLWIFPDLGVRGAAITSIISNGIGGVLGLWMLYTGRTRIRLTLKNFRFDGSMIWRIVKIGIPAMINGSGRTSASLVLTTFISPFGTFAVAAHSLMQRIDGFIQMPAMALGQASGVLAGQNLGAGKPDRAEKTTWISVGLFTGIMFVVSIYLWIWPESVIKLFDTEAGLVDVASIFLRIQIVQYMTFGFGMVMMNSLMGVGDTLTPMLNTVITLWLVQMPLAYFLSKYTSLGVYGVRWAMVIAVVVRGIMFAGYFKMGRWKNKKI